MGLSTGYTPVGDLITFFIGIIMLVTLFQSYMRRTVIFRIFLMALITTCVCAVANVILYAVLSMEQPNLAIALTARSVYRIGIVMILQLYIMYVQQLISLDGKLLFYGSFVLNAVLAALDIAFGIVGIFDIRTPFTHPILLSYAYSTAVCLVLLVHYRNRIIRPVSRGYPVRSTSGIYRAVA